MAEDAETKKIDSAFENLGARGLRLQDLGMGDDLYLARFDMELEEWNPGGADVLRDHGYADPSSQV